MIAVERPKLADCIHRGIAQVRRTAAEQGVYTELGDIEPPSRRDQVWPGRGRFGGVRVSTAVRRDVISSGGRQCHRKCSDERLDLVHGVPLQFVPKARCKRDVDLAGPDTAEELDSCGTCAFERVDDDTGVAGHAYD